MPNAEGRMEITQEQIDEAEYDVRQSMAADDRQTTAEYNAGERGLHLILDALAARTREVEAMREDAERWRFIADRLYSETVHIGTVHARFSVTVEGKWSSLTEYVDAMLRRALAAQEGTR